MSTGQPVLLNGPAPTTDLQLATTDSSDARLQAVTSDWGVYLNNAKALFPDSIIAVDYKGEHVIADYQIEKGAFESYDKVEKPFDLRVRMTKGGSESDRSEFLEAVEQARASLTIFDVVTPVKTYLSVNFTAIALQQTATNGVGLLTIDLTLRQVRVTANVAFSADTVKSPSAADPSNGGAVQPQAVPVVTQAKVRAALAPASAANAPGF